jgi:hypothetical protein
MRIDDGSAEASLNLSQYRDEKSLIPSARAHSWIETSYGRRSRPGMVFDRRRRVFYKGPQILTAMGFAGNHSPGRIDDPYFKSV